MASWSKLNYSQRLFLWLVGYSLLLVGCFVVFQYNREKAFKAEELNARLQLVNARLLDEISRNGGRVDSLRYDEFPFDYLRVSVIDYDGNVVFDNTLDTLPSYSHLNREEIAEALNEGTGYTLRRHSESSDNFYFYSARKGDGIIVRSAIPYSVSLHELLSADYGFLWFMAFVTVLMCTIGYAATRKLGRNIQRLNRFAERAERGERIYDMEPFTHDELGDISNHIVRLYARLQKAMADIAREHKAALHEEREKIRIKKQLTNNINHELKTPVASIVVCLETIISRRDMSADKRDEFVERCYSNALRLRKLLDDVSIITRMDDGGATVIKENVDLSAIIRETLHDFEVRAAGAGVSINLHQPDKLMMNGNAGLLLSIFHNLLDNALSYSGCSSVDINVDGSDEHYVTVSFRDNGCGIPQEHIPHIFERFYRVDKGRSRKAGGTGLGLAIVKNAVALHGGSISVENRVPEGLEFVLTLRKT
ncbi:MAG: sensor histidine kinase [Muribaculum sp.]